MTVFEPPIAAGRSFCLGTPSSTRSTVLLIVDVHARLEREFGDDRRVDVDEPPLRVVGHEVAAAGLAPLPVTVGALAEGADLVGPLQDLDAGRGPQRESVDRARAPQPARVAMAVAHPGRLAADGQLHRSAKTAPSIRLVLAHVVPPSRVAEEPTPGGDCWRKADQTHSRGDPAISWISGSRHRRHRRPARARAPLDLRGADRDLQLCRGPLADDPPAAAAAPVRRARRLPRRGGDQALHPRSAETRGDAGLGEADRPHHRPDGGVRSRRLEPRQRGPDPLAAPLVRARGERRRHLHRRVAAGGGRPARRAARHHPLGDGRRVSAALSQGRLATRSLRHRIGSDLLRRRRLFGDRSQPLSRREVLRTRGGRRDGEGAPPGDTAHVAVRLRRLAAALGPRRRSGPAGAGLAVSQLQAGGEPRRPRRPRRDEPAQLRPPLHRGDRRDAARLPAPPADRRRPPPARDARQEHRRRQSGGRLRRPRVLPPPVQAPHRRAAPGLPGPLRSGRARAVAGAG